VNGLRRLIERLRDLGVRPDDSAEERLAKRLQTAMAIGSVFIIALWSLSFVRVGLAPVAWFHAAYCLGTVALLSLVALTGRYEWVRYGHIALVTIGPFSLHWYLGGFNGSGGAFLWAFLAPLASVIFLSHRAAVVVVVALTSLLVASLWAEVLPWPQALRLPADERARQLLGNAIGMLVFGFVSMSYFRRRLEEERRRSERLLLNVLPQSIAERLKRGESPIADRVEAATIVFADLVGFTTLAGRLPPEEVVVMLNAIFSRFDEIADRHHLEKVKTIGDAYMAVAGLPEPSADHARDAARAALEMRAAVRELASACSAELDMRIGLHTGAVVAGVIGLRKFAYDLWGDAVNIASRMESHGQPGRVQVSADAAAHLERFVLDARGEIEIKGKGMMKTYWLVEEK
jgi:adenylate cyclase